MTMDVTSELAAKVPEIAADWAVEAEDLDLPFVAMGQLARRVVSVADASKQVDFKPLFDEVETRLSTGDEALRELLIIGFLEGLQNIDAGGSSRWERLLGPATMEAWVGLNDVWAGRLDPAAFKRIIEGSSDIAGR
jgi:hypothetical protein